jgi:hypothetical protein
MVDSYRTLTALRTAMIRWANAATVLRFNTPARLSVYDTLLERLPQDLQDMATELGEFIQEEHAMVGPRPLARHRHVTPTDQSRIRDGMVGRSKRTGRDPRRAGTGEAGHAGETRGLKGLGEGHRR